jgi:hypothetical protein
MRDRSVPWQTVTVLSCVIVPRIFYAQLRTIFQSGEEVMDAIVYSETRTVDSLGSWRMFCGEPYRTELCAGSCRTL